MGSAFFTDAPPIHSRSISLYAIRAAEAFELLPSVVGIAQATYGANERIFAIGYRTAGSRTTLSMRRRDTAENWRKSDPIAARKPKSFSPRIDNV
jgi:hypothetical protein